MTDTLMEQIKDASGWGDATINTQYVRDMESRILRDAETIKAAEALAVVAMNTQCATQEDANRLAREVAAFRATHEKNDDEV